MKTILRYFKKYKIKSILAPVFKMLEAGFELLIPLVMASIIDVGIKNNDRSYIYKMSLIVILLGFIGLACAITAQYFSAKAAMGIAGEIRADLFKHINKMSYAEIDSIGNATLISRITNDVNQVQTGINMFLRLFTRSPFIVFGAAIMAFTVDAKTAMVFLVTLPVLIIIVFGIMLITIPLYKRVAKGLDKVLQITRENLSGVKVIRAFNRSKKEKMDFEESAESLNKGQLLAGWVSSFLNPLTFAVVNISIIAILWIGGKQVNIGATKQGDVYAIVNYMSQILIELVKLASLIIIETKAIASANRVASILNKKSGMEYKEGSAKNDPCVDSGKNKDQNSRANSSTNPGKNKDKNSRKIPCTDFGKNEVKDSKAKIQFINAELAYNNSKVPSIKGLNFSVNKGETLGIIGGTGSGKTTLINLIPRFYDCTNGQVLIDGVDVKDYPKDKLRAKIGIVPQRAVLFRGSIRDNIRWGKEDATDEEIYNALEIAQAKQFVDEKDDGLGHIINQSAKNLSGGQKQRLTIARALVRKPEILILDDSSSALDYATEAALREALSNNENDMTILIVSQRISSIINADNIVVVDDGEIVGAGRHDELINSCEEYIEIYNSQNSINPVTSGEAPVETPSKAPSKTPAIKSEEVLAYE